MRSLQLNCIIASLVALAGCLTGEGRRPKLWPYRARGQHLPANL